MTFWRTMGSKTQTFFKVSSFSTVERKPYRFGTTRGQVTDRTIVFLHGNAALFQPEAPKQHFKEVTCYLISVFWDGSQVHVWICWDFTESGTAVQMLEVNAHLHEECCCSSVSVWGRELTAHSKTTHISQPLQPNQHFIKPVTVHKCKQISQ